jgi:hypothetical protein
VPTESSRIDTRWAPIRDDPRFQHLRGLVGLSATGIAPAI